MSGGFLLCGEKVGVGCAAAGVARMDWDSEHFNAEIGELLLTSTGRRGKELLANIIPEVLARASRDGWQHISVHVDSTDTELAEILLGAGFWQADTKMVYRYGSHGSDSSPRLLFSPREMREDDIEQVRNIVARADFPSRFSRDTFFCPDRVVDMHLCWLQNILARPAPERIACVAESDGNIMAFAVSEYVERLDRSPHWRGYSRALAAGEKRACGAALSAVGAMTSVARERDSDIECVVSAHNRAANRGLSYLGYKLSGRQFVLHRRLQEASVFSGFRSLGRSL